MGNSKVTRTRKGPAIASAINEMVRQIYDAGAVSVGVHDDDELYPETGVTVAQAAFWNEFGTPNAKHPTPERSFLRSTAKQQKKWVTNHITRMVLQKIAKPESGKSYRAILEGVGTHMVFAVQNKIKSNIAPENSPWTLKRKLAKNHGSRTLIDTGALLRSINYRITPISELE